MEINFEFAKKMAKPAKGAAGITLRSIAGDALSCAMIVVADSYADIRSSVGSYRMLTARALTAVSRGKSLEIRADAAPGEQPDAISVLFDFLQTMKFNTEEALDVVDFFREFFGVESGFGLRPCSIDLSPDALSLKVSADAADGDAAAALLAELGERCGKYRIGIIK